MTAPQHPGSRSATVPDDQIVIGQVVGAFGLAGEVKVRLETSFPERLQQGRVIFAGSRRLTLQRVRLSTRGATLGFAEISDRTAAEALRGQLLTVPKASLPPLPAGTFYYYELIGLEAVSPSGEVFGPVVDIFATGANDVYVVRTGQGEMLVPAIEDVVLAIEPAAGRIVIAPLEGMMPTPPRPRRRRASRSSSPRT
ncbi:MAG: ribosome maturation factor RimM [Dehalococcoidia bacterium]|nr:MAG: ribosome maturation factor RimM [Dehalococcoidia bacterium]